MRTAVGRALALAAAMLAAAPQLALACPTCAAREGSGTWGLILVGGMIALPFTVAAIAFSAIRRLERRR